MSGFSLAQVPRDLPTWQQNAFRSLAISNYQNRINLSTIARGETINGGQYYTSDQALQTNFMGSTGGAALLNESQTFTKAQYFQGSELSSDDIVTIAQTNGGSFLFNYKATAAAGKIKLNDSSLAQTGVCFTNDDINEKILAVDLTNLSDNSTRTLSPLNYSGAIPVVGNAVSAASGSIVSVNLSDQSAGIAATPLTSSPTPGMYMISVYAVCTTADVTAPIIQVRFDYTDDYTLGPQIESLGGGSGMYSLDLAIGGSRMLYNFPICISSGNITYQVDEPSPFNDARYSLYIRLTYLG